jgi:hypothetical protein
MADTRQHQDLLRNLLQTHNWNAPGNHKSDHHDYVMSVQLLQGPVEGTKERSVPQATLGFSYQQDLRELTHGYVVCCLDNGVAVTLLAHFAATPVLGNDQALESTCKILWATNDLLHVKAPDIMHDSMLPIFLSSNLVPSLPTLIHLMQSTLRPGSL